MLEKKTLVGFGFGAIQTGLFLWEAQRSGHFERLVIAVPNPELIAGVRRNGGSFKVNVATPTGRKVGEIFGVEMMNPMVESDRHLIVDAIADAAELSTALPSIATYDQPGASVAQLLADGLRSKMHRIRAKPCILYAAENHNHAAEILFALVERRLAPEERTVLRSIFQPLDTVIGKMSRIVRDPAEIEGAGLEPYVEGGSRAFLVEEFNRILVSQVTLPGFKRGIPSFLEKADLMPFEEAKLYGHNASHALLGYLARERGLSFMAEAAGDSRLMAFVREAFLEESGRALIARRGGIDPLFTRAGFEVFAQDLLERMVNPWLRDEVGRVTRDCRRKLGWDDRLVGTMRLALANGVTPNRFAIGAASALRVLQGEDSSKSKPELLDEIWGSARSSAAEVGEIRALILGAGHLSS